MSTDLSSRDRGNFQMSCLCAEKPEILTFSGFTTGLKFPRSEQSHGSQLECRKAVTPWREEWAARDGQG